MSLKPTFCSSLMTLLTTSSLRKLQLIQIGMREDSFNKFLEFLRKSQLEQLDVRDSRVTAIQFLHLLEVLKSNRQLKYLNLGYNNLCAATASNEYKNYGNTGGLETIHEEGGARPSSPMKGKADDNGSKLSVHQ